MRPSPLSSSTASTLDDNTAASVTAITGGASNIGRAAAVAFAREGARIMIVDIDALAARDALGLQLRLDDDLRRDARVVGAELPERVVAAHPVVTDQHVHQRHLERVPHVQRAGHVRRRNHDRVRMPGATRAEAALGQLGRASSRDRV